MTVARAEEKLKLGKGAAFVKGRLKRLRQENETWEADFQALPRPVTQSQTHYLGMVVAPGGSFLADAHVEGRPTVNDMATLLAHAMRRPADREGAPAPAHPRPGAPAVEGAIPPPGRNRHQGRRPPGASESAASLPGLPAAATRRPPGRDGEADLRAADRGEAVPGHRSMGPGLRAHRDRRPGDVRLRRQGAGQGERVKLFLSWWLRSRF